MLLVLWECRVVISSRTIPAIHRKSFGLFVNSLVGLSINTKVSVFADVTGQCKKGFLKPYASSSKVYLGNGILQQTRKQLFGKTAENPWWVAIAGLSCTTADSRVVLPCRDFCEYTVISATIRATEWAMLCTLPSSGIAIIMTDVISRVPQLNATDESLRPRALLQNLPSIICCLVLNPQPGETILDMCAAPGNKTTHISYLMKGQVCAWK